VRPPALLAFCESLQDTELSQTIQNSSDLIALLQSFHIVALSALFIAMLVFNIRVLSNRFHDGAYLSGFKYNALISLPVLLVTGIFLIIAEPARSLANDAFQLKMILLVLVLLLYRHLLSCVSTQTDFPASSHHLSVANKLLAALSILMWISIIFAGRWIAYL